MSSSGYTAWNVTAGEVPTTAYWNILGYNDASFNTGNGFNDSAIVARHLSASALGAIYPIGAIYIETTGTNPNTIFGFGTWISFGNGQALIGAGTSDATYTAGTTGGGSKHQHQTLFSFDGGAFYASVSGTTLSGDTPGTAVTTTNRLSIGGSGSTNGARLDNTFSASSLPPYIVVYFWKRTA